MGLFSHTDLIYGSLFTYRSHLWVSFHIQISFMGLFSGEIGRGNSGDALCDFFFEQTCCIVYTSHMWVSFHIQISLMGLFSHTDLIYASLLVYRSHIWVFFHIKISFVGLFSGEIGRGNTGDVLCDSAFKRGCCISFTFHIWVSFHIQISYMGLFWCTDLTYGSCFMYRSHWWVSLCGQKQEAILETRVVIRLSSEDAALYMDLIYGSLFTYRSHLWVSFRKK